MEPEFIRDADDFGCLERPCEVEGKNAVDLRETYHPPSTASTMPLRTAMKILTDPKLVLFPFKATVILRKEEVFLSTVR